MIDVIAILGLAESIVFCEVGALGSGQFRPKPVEDVLALGRGPLCFSLGHHFGLPW